MQLNCLILVTYQRQVVKSRKKYPVRSLLLVLSKWPVGYVYERRNEETSRI